jgi:hypothetical protein
MAIQVIDLPTQPSSNAGADLAQVLSGAADDYVSRQDAQKRRQQQLDDEARRRQEQLSDVASARDFETGRDATSRAFEMTEFDRHEAVAEKARTMHAKGDLRDAVVQMLITSRPPYLSPDQADNQAAIQAAWDAAKRDGMLDKYSDLIHHGYLKIDDIGDPKAVEAAQQKAADASSAGFTSASQTKAAASSAAGNVAAQIRQEQGKVESLQSAVQQATSNAQNPPQDEIMKEAVRLASAVAGPGKVPSRQQISDSMEQASQSVAGKYATLAAQLDAQAKAFIPEHLKIIQGLEGRASQFEKNNIFATPDDSADPADATAAAAPAPGRADGRQDDRRGHSASHRRPPASPRGRH